MLKSPLVWSLATLFASLGLLVAIALDALRGRPTDHLLPRNFASAGTTGSSGALKPQKAEKKQPVIDASFRSVMQPHAVHTDAAHAAAPPAPVSKSALPPGTTAPAVPVAQTSAPWLSVTVTSSIAGSSSKVSTAHERNPSLGLGLTGGGWALPHPGMNFGSKNLLAG